MIWDYQETEYKKQIKADPLWHLERIINYGLNTNKGEKINKKLLEKHLPELKIPENRRDFLKLLLWNEPF